VQDNVIGVEARLMGNLVQVSIKKITWFKKNKNKDKHLLYKAYHKYKKMLNGTHCIKPIAVCRKKKLFEAIRPVLRNSHIVLPSA